eukprot:TRINITY_DN9605_c0_g3_i1.p1 TRINITY_DN9605_c0_g3~~TRINITY_DN9605_c0_g3_i1.p1  ORF type:complete len:973 (+),score=342.76 TRINITY_DN9605_c0_g3_i1:106-3024(+)
MRWQIASIAVLAIAILVTESAPISKPEDNFDINIPSEEDLVKLSHQPSEAALEGNGMNVPADQDEGKEQAAGISQQEIISEASLSNEQTPKASRPSFHAEALSDDAVERKQVSDAETSAIQPKLVGEGAELLSEPADKSALTAQDDDDYASAAKRPVAIQNSKTSKDDDDDWETAFETQEDKDSNREGAADAETAHKQATEQVADPRSKAERTPSDGTTPGSDTLPYGQSDTSLSKEIGGEVKAEGVLNPADVLEPEGDINTPNQLDEDGAANPVSNGKLSEDATELDSEQLNDEDEAEQEQEEEELSWDAEGDKIKTEDGNADNGASQEDLGQVDENKPDATTEDDDDDPFADQETGASKGSAREEGQLQYEQGEGPLDEAAILADNEKALDEQVEGEQADLSTSPSMDKLDSAKSTVPALHDREIDQGEKIPISAHNPETNSSSTSPTPAGANADKATVAKEAVQTDVTEGSEAPAKPSTNTSPFVTLHLTKSGDRPIVTSFRPQHERGPHNGMLVEMVQEGGDAARAGLQVDDEIVQVGTLNLTSTLTQHRHAMIKEQMNANAVDVVVYRSAQAQAMETVRELVDEGASEKEVDELKELVQNESEEEQAYLAGHERAADGKDEEIEEQLAAELEESPEAEEAMEEGESADPAAFAQALLKKEKEEREHELADAEQVNINDQADKDGAETGDSGVKESANVIDNAADEEKEAAESAVAEDDDDDDDIEAEPVIPSESDDDDDAEADVSAEAEDDRAGADDDDDDEEHIIEDMNHARIGGQSDAGLRNGGDEEPFGRDSTAGDAQAESNAEEEDISKPDWLRQAEHNGDMNEGKDGETFQDVNDAVAEELEEESYGDLEGDKDSTSFGNEPAEANRWSSDRRPPSNEQHNADPLPVSSLSKTDNAKYAEEIVVPDFEEDAGFGSSTYGILFIFVVGAGIAFVYHRKVKAAVFGSPSHRGGKQVYSRRQHRK